MKKLLLLGLLGCNHGSPLPGGEPERAPLCITQVQAANELTCAVRRDGKVFCWGRLYYDDTRYVDYATPTAVAGLPPVVEVANAGTHVCARSANGDVWCWGWNYHGELGQPKTVPGSITPLLADHGADAIAAGDYDTCILRGGAAECWGITPSAPSGGGVTGPWSYSPVPIPELSPSAALILGSAWSCALDAERALRCWGDNWGTLGDGTYDSHPAPVAVTALDHDVVQMSAGEEHNCAVLTDGTVWCWGATGGLQGPLVLPTQVAAVSGAVAVAAGATDSCAALRDGRVVCWSREVDPAQAPVRTAALPRPALAVTATYQKACALLDDGSAWCWGNGGSSDPATLAAPARVPIDCP